MGGHGVVESVVDRETDEEEERGISEGIEVVVGEGCPSLGACWWKRILLRGWRRWDEGTEGFGLWWTAYAHLVFSNSS